MAANPEQLRKMAEAAQQAAAKAAEAARAAQGSEAKNQQSSEASTKKEAPKGSPRRERHDLQTMQKKQESFVAKAVGNLPISDEVYHQVKDYATSQPPELQEANTIGRHLAKQVKEASKNPQEAVEIIMHIGSAYGSSGSEREYYAGLIRDIQAQHHMEADQLLEAARTLGRSTQLSESVVNRHSSAFINELAQDNHDLVKALAKGMAEKAMMEAAAVHEAKEKEKKRRQEEEDAAAEAEEQKPDAQLEESQVYVGVGEPEVIVEQTEVAGEPKAAEIPIEGVVFEGTGKPEAVDVHITDDLQEAGATSSVREKYHEATDLKDPEKVSEALGLVHEGLRPDVEELQAFDRVLEDAANKVIEKKESRDVALDLTQELQQEETNIAELGQKYAVVAEQAADDAQLEALQPYLAVSVLKKLDPSVAGHIDNLFKAARGSGEMNLNDYREAYKALNQLPKEAQRAVLDYYGELLKPQMHEPELINEYLNEVYKEKPNIDRLKELLARIDNQVPEGIPGRVLEALEHEANKKITGVYEPEMSFAPPTSGAKPEGGGGPKKYKSVTEAQEDLDAYTKGAHLFADDEARRRKLGDIAERIVGSKYDTDNPTPEIKKLIKDLKEQQGILEQTYQAQRQEELIRRGDVPVENFSEASRKYQDAYQEILKLLYEIDPKTGQLVVEVVEKIDPKTKKPILDPNTGKTRMVSRFKSKIMDPYAREYVEKALGSVSQFEFGNTISTLRQRQRFLEGHIKSRKKVPPVPKFKGNDEFLINNVIDRLQEMRDLFPMAVEPRFEARKKMLELGNEIVHIADTRKKETINGEDVDTTRVIGEKPGKIISTALHAATSDEIRQRIGYLQEIAADLQKNGEPEQAYLINEIIPRLQRQAELLRYAPRAGEAVDYHFRQVGLAVEDIAALNRLDNVDQILEDLQAGNLQDNFNTLWDTLLRAQNVVFSSADRTANLPFEQSYSALIEDPVNKQIVSTVQRFQVAISKILESDDFLAKKLQVTVELPTKNGLWKEEKVGLGKAFELLYQKMIADREMREYTHNVHYIIITRGSLEDIAKYASKLRVGTVEMALFGRNEKMVQEAARLYEMELQKQLGDENWSIKARLFAQLPEYMGNSEIDELIKAQLKHRFGEGVEDWQLNKAMAVGRGVLMGVTSSGLDWLAQADPPRGRLGYVGYVADSILGAYNYMRHHVFKWWGQVTVTYDEHGKEQLSAGHPWARLFFISMKDPDRLTSVIPLDKIYDALQHHPSRFFSKEWKKTVWGVLKKEMTWSQFNKRMDTIVEGWDPNHYVDKMFTHARDTRTNLRQTEDAIDTPFIQIANMFKIGGVIYRKGWRYNGAFLHHFTSSDGKTGEQLLGGGGILDWRKVDLDKTWEKIKQVGYGGLHWFVEQIETAGVDQIGKGKTLLKIAVEEPNGKKEYVHRLKVEVMKLIWTRNPIKFIRLDPTAPKTGEGKEAANSIRMKALAYLRQKYTNNIGLFSKADLSGVTKDVDRLERDAAIITTFLVEKNKWAINKLSPAEKNELKSMLGSLTPEDREFGFRKKGESLPHRLDEAMAYWRAVQRVVLMEKDDVSGKSWLDFFADQKLPWGMGTEDLNYREVKWVEMGESVVPRALGDAHSIAESTVKPLFNFGELLEEAAAHQSFEPLFKYLQQARVPINSVHGPGATDEFTYKMALLFARYFDKAWYGQLPLGLGTLFDFRQNLAPNDKYGISFSKQNQGTQAWAWDEQITRSFIDEIVKKGWLPRSRYTPSITHAHKYYAGRLMAELGARNFQVSGDIVRSSSPWFVFLAFVALSQVARQESEGSSGGGGGGHH